MKSSMRPNLTPGDSGSSFGLPRLPCLSKSSGFGGFALASRNSASVRRSLPCLTRAGKQRRGRHGQRVRSADRLALWARPAGRMAAASRAAPARGKRCRSYACPGWQAIDARRSAKPVDLSPTSRPGSARARCRRTFCGRVSLGHPHPRRPCPARSVRHRFLGAAGPGICFFPVGCFPDSAICARTRELGGEDRAAALRRLVAAVAEAALRGYDRSGRFRRSENWLERSEREGVQDFPELDAAALDAGWTEWEAVADAGTPETLVVIRQPRLPLAGPCLALVVTLFFWHGRGWPARTRLAVLLLWLASTGTALFWLPASVRELATWPLLAGCVTALGWHFGLWSGADRVPDADAKRPSTRPAQAGILLLAFFLPTVAALLPWARAEEDAPATRFTVLEVPAGPDEPARRDVLVTPDLLEQINRLGRPGESTGARPVLTQASYQGELRDDLAVFHATFRIYCPADGAATLLLPLENVQLTGPVSLDEADALPVATRQPRAGYLLSVSGKGNHKVELSFQCGVQRTGDDRTVLFTVPPILQSELTLDLPVDAAGPQARMGQSQVGGIQELTALDAGWRLRAELGRLKRTIANSLAAGR